MHRCEACNEEIFGTLKQFNKHRRTLKHRQFVVLKAGASYQVANKQSLYCRCCALKFKNEDELFSHRKTEEHYKKHQEERKASYCHVCKKQFNSPNQLNEHIKGKAHLAAVGERTGFVPDNLKSLFPVSHPEGFKKRKRRRLKK